MYDNYRPPQMTLLPTVVKNLLIINVIFFLATIAFQNQFDLTDYLGLHYPTSTKFRVYQFVTYMFMHGSIEHIFFNMFALWMFGYAIENYWGPKRFLNYYLFCGLGAAATHYAIYFFQVRDVLAPVNAYLDHPTLSALPGVMDHIQGLDPKNISDALRTALSHYNAAGTPDEQLRASVELLAQYRIDFLNAPVVVGASGSIFGILLAFGMMFPNSMIYMYFFLPMKAKYFVILYGAIELFSGLRAVPGDNVAHFAHLGGMLFGLILLLYWRNRSGRMYH